METINEEVLGEFTEDSADEGLEVPATVSGGDSGNTASGNDNTWDYEAFTAALSAMSEDNHQLLSELEEQQATAELTIMEKPVAEYTPTEGMLLILVFIALGWTIFKIVGGIIKV